MTRKSCCAATPPAERFTVAVRYTWTVLPVTITGICAGCVSELETERGAGIVSARPFLKPWMILDRHAPKVAPA